MNKIIQYTLHTNNERLGAVIYKSFSVSTPHYFPYVARVQVVANLIVIRGQGQGWGSFFFSAKKEKRQNRFPKKKKQPMKTAGMRNQKKKKQPMKTAGMRNQFFFNAKSNYNC
jgi:hypothetical protein